MKTGRVLTWLVILALSWILPVVGCVAPRPKLPDSFSTSTLINNPYFPLVPGTTFIYENKTGEGIEKTIVKVLNTTRDVIGIPCIVLWDRVFLNGVLVEDTHDWYAQDDGGNVWYMGEDVDNYHYDESGTLTSITHEGAWEAGLDVAGLGVRAYPGIVMKASPRIGDSYRQEYYKGGAEDMAAVIDSDLTISVAGTVYSGCLKTRDWNPLEPGPPEYKYFAPHVGLVLEEVLDEEFGVVERVELRSISRP